MGPARGRGDQCPEGVEVWAVPAVQQLLEPQEMLYSRAEVAWLESCFKENFGITAWRTVIS